MFGNYRLTSFLGRGGMAVVYRATAITGKHAGEDLVIKRMLPEASLDPVLVDAFLTEAEVTQRLHHPNIVSVFEAGAVGDEFFMAMEYVDGRDLGAILHQCIARRILLPVDFCAFLADKIAQALDFAHHATDDLGEPLHVVHCDVTPSNIFVSHLGAIKLGDFGVARTRGTRSALDGMLAAGKASYLAPEQILGEPVTPCTDVFALGVMLYELLTGTRPFLGTSSSAETDIEQVWDQIIAGKVTPPQRLRPELSDALNEVVMRALAPQRAGDRDRSLLAQFKIKFGRRERTRYSDAGQLGRDLRGLYDAHVGTPLAIAAVVRGLFRTPRA